MDAVLLLREKFALTENAFVELVIWRVPQPLRGSTHHFKYRLALVEDEICVLRYDNEAGKGDHKHLGKKEMPFFFAGLEQLQSDFWADVDLFMKTAENDT